MVWNPDQHWWTENPDVQTVYNFERQENTWRTLLTEPEREAWRTKWTTDPPRSVTGRYYVTHTPTAWNQTQVSEARAFAWEHAYDSAPGWPAHFDQTGDWYNAFGHHVGVCTPWSEAQHDLIVWDFLPMHHFQVASLISAPSTNTYTKPKLCSAFFSQVTCLGYSLELGQLFPGLMEMPAYAQRNATLTVLLPKPDGGRLRIFYIGDTLIDAV